MSQDSDRPREARLRRMARRQRLAVVKSRARNVQSHEHGRYMVIDADRNWVVAGGHPLAYSLDLDGVAEVLRERAE